jgi:hypothetical protein
MLRSNQGHQELSANVSGQAPLAETLRVWLRVPDLYTPLPITGEPFLAGFLIPCMFLSEALHVNAPISSRLMHSLSTIQSILVSWFPCLQRISVTCSQLYASHSKLINTPSIGCFFSGGVDSWYSFLKNKERVSHLILVYGFDIRQHHSALWQSTSYNVERIAQQYDKKLISIETNFRLQAGDFWGKHYPRSFWPNYMHGSSLAAMGLCLREIIGEVIIPASRTYTDLSPWASHLVLDPLWSTEDLLIVHDGCEASRLQKVREYVARAPLALETLRVCNSAARAEEYNCCYCEKCLRTMLELRICGILEKAVAFSKPLDLKLVARLDLQNQARRQFYEEILDAAVIIGDKELSSRLEVVLGRRLSVASLIAYLQRKFESMRGSRE